MTLIIHLFGLTNIFNQARRNRFVYVFQSPSWKFSASYGCTCCEAIKSSKQIQSEGIPCNRLTLSSSTFLFYEINHRFQEPDRFTHWASGSNGSARVAIKTNSIHYISDKFQCSRSLDPDNYIVDKCFTRCLKCEIGSAGECLKLCSCTESPRETQNVSGSRENFPISMIRRSRCAVRGSLIKGLGSERDAVTDNGGLSDRSIQLRRVSLQNTTINFVCGRTTRKRIFFLSIFLILRKTFVPSSSPFTVLLIVSRHMLCMGSIRGASKSRVAPLNQGDPRPPAAIN